MRSKTTNEIIRNPWQQVKERANLKPKAIGRGFRGLQPAV
jgi:hypothetical protein